MNELARLYAEKRLEQLERAEMRKIVADLRESQANLRPLIAEANARQKARMRQDGPTGFVMVQK